MTNQIQNLKAKTCLVSCSLFILFFSYTIIPDSAFAEISLPPAEDTGLDPFIPTNGDGVRDDTGNITLGHLILGEAVSSVTKVIKALLGAIAIAWIVWNAIVLITAEGSDERVEDGKRGVTWGALGLMFALMADTVILDVLYGGRGFEAATALDDSESINNSIEAGTQLTLDMLQWLKGLIIIGAVGFTIYSGIRMISALGNEEEITSQRTTFLWIGLGIIIILLNDVIIREVLYPRILGDDFAVTYAPDSVRGISEAVALIRYFLQFMALIAFLAFLYGGGKMVTSFGNDEQVEDGKKILYGAIIGIVVVLMSFVIVSTFVSGTVG